MRRKAACPDAKVENAKVPYKTAKVSDESCSNFSMVFGRKIGRIMGSIIILYAR